MGSIHHPSPLDILLQHRDQGHHGLCRDPLHRVVYQLQVRPVQHRVQYASVVAVESLSQELCQGVCAGSSSYSSGGGLGGEQGDTVLGCRMVRL